MNCRIAFCHGKIFLMYTNKKKKKTYSFWFVCFCVAQLQNDPFSKPVTNSFFSLVVIVVKTRFCSCHISSKTLKNEKK